MHRIPPLVKKNRRTKPPVTKLHGIYENIDNQKKNKYYFWSKDDGVICKQILTGLGLTLECLINVLVRVFNYRKMPPYTGLIWHYRVYVY